MFSQTLSHIICRITTTHLEYRLHWIPANIIVKPFRKRKIYMLAKETTETLIIRGNATKGRRFGRGWPTFTISRCRWRFLTVITWFCSCLSVQLVTLASWRYCRPAQKAARASRDSNDGEGQLDGVKDKWRDTTYVWWNRSLIWIIGSWQRKGEVICFWTWPWICVINIITTILFITLIPKKQEIMQCSGNGNLESQAYSSMKSIDVPQTAMAL